MQYGRGARARTRQKIIEDGGGDFRYVTLTMFHGDARRREEYAAPAAAARRAAA